MREPRENDVRLKAFASIVMLVSFAFGFGAHAQQSDISAESSPAQANLQRFPYIGE
jgi:hypothetical protein